MRSNLSRLAACVIAFGFYGAASAATLNLQCTRTDGSGGFKFLVDLDTKLVTVGRFSGMVAQITDQTIIFKYHLGQLWGREDTPEYDINFDRASGLFSSHTPAGADRNGKRWPQVDATSTCK